MADVDYDFDDPEHDRIASAVTIGVLRAVGILAGIGFVVWLLGRFALHLV